MYFPPMTLRMTVYADHITFLDLAYLLTYHMLLIYSNDYVIIDLIHEEWAGIAEVLYQVFNLDKGLMHL